MVYGMSNSTKECWFQHPVSVLEFWFAIYNGSSALDQAWGAMQVPRFTARASILEAAPRGGFYELEHCAQWQYEHSLSSLVNLGTVLESVVGLW